MHELNTEEINILRPLVERHLKVTKLGHRTSVDFALSSAVMAIHADTGKVWCDDVENPTCYVFASVVRRSLFNEVAGLVEAIYVDESCKRKASSVTKMVKQAETYFKFKKCSVSHLSSWVMGDLPDLSKIWHRMGYATQEIITTKTL